MGDVLVINSKEMLRKCLYILLLVLTLRCAKCDKYVEVELKKGELTMKDFMCKKGCAMKNDTACQKCSDIKDKDFCDHEDIIGCQWKVKCVSNSCPNIAKISDDEKNKNPDRAKFDADDHDNNKKICKVLGCLYSKSKERCSYLSLWALIVIIVVAVVVVVAIIVVIILVVFVCGKKTPPAKVTPANTSPAEDKPLGTPINSRSDVVASAEASPEAEVVGPYVIVKMGTHDQRTKSVQDGPELGWGENVVLANLGGEDEDAEFELWNQDTQLAKAVVRIVDYVNNKTHVSVTLKDSSDTTLGVLETDIEIKVDESKTPPEVGAEIFVDKYNKAAL